MNPKEKECASKAGAAFDSKLPSWFRRFWCPGEAFLFLKVCSFLAVRLTMRRSHFLAVCVKSEEEEKKNQFWPNTPPSAQSRPRNF